MTELITTLRVEDVYPNPRHYREVKPEAVAALAANIAVAGQLEPIRVWRDGDIYIIDAGHHRHAAIKSLGIEEIDAIVVDTDDVQAMVASNMHFAESEIERSRGTQLLLATGVRPLEAAALVGVDQDTVSKAARGIKVVADECACEDLTLDRLVAIAEFDDDPGMVDALLNAPEEKWRAIARAFRDNRLRAKKVEAAKVEVEKAGCALIEREQAGNYFYLDRGPEKPDEAVAAVIVSYDWSTNVEIVWYAALDTAKADAEAQARAAERAECDQRDAELELAGQQRRRFVADYLAGESVSPSNGLRDLAVEMWEGGTRAQAVDIHEDLEGVKGFLSRIYAAILSLADARVGLLFRGNSSSYYIELLGPYVVRYLEALQGCGYELTAIETAELAELKESLAGDDDE
jgi:ParB-like chromosome segregation protein Spo0J